MLVKLSVVSTAHLLLYKPRITHCDDGKTVTEFLASVILDNTNSLDVSSISEVLVGKSFIETSCVDVSCLELITMMELRSSLNSGGNVHYFFLFLIIVLIVQIESF